MKKSFLAFVLVIMTLLAFNAFASDNPQFYITASNVQRGQSTNVSVYVENAVEYCGFSFELMYDSSVFTVGNISPAEDFVSEFTIVNGEYDDGIAFMSYAQATPCSKNGNVLNIELICNDNAQCGIYNLQFADIRLYDQDSNQIDVDFSGRAVCVVGDENALNVKLEAPETVVAGENITVNAVVSATSGYCGIRYILKYDSDKFEVVSAQVAQAFQSDLTQVRTDYSDNEIFVSYPSIEPVTVGGTMLTVVFKAKENADGNAFFDVKGLRVYDENSDSMNCSFEYAQTKFVLGEFSLGYNPDTEKIIVTCPKAMENVTLVVAGYSQDESQLEGVMHLDFSCTPSQIDYSLSMFGINSPKIKAMLYGDFSSFEPLCNVIDIM